MTIMILEYPKGIKSHIDSTGLRISDPGGGVRGSGGFWRAEAESVIRIFPSRQSSGMSWPGGVRVAVFCYFLEGGEGILV